MVTPANDGELTVNTALDLRGLSTDPKPTNVPNGSTVWEMDTGKIFAFDKENNLWREA